MKRCIAFLGLIIVLVSCKNDKQKPVGDPQEFETTQTTLDSTDFDRCAEKKCPELNITYLTIKGDSDFADSINKKNQEELAGIFNLSQDEEESGSDNIKEAIENFVSDYFEFKEDFPSSSASYEAQVEQEMQSKNERTVVFKTQFYLFTGGAHGYGGVRFFNYDAHTGKYLTHEDLISDIPAFTEFVEEKFRQQNDIPPDASINAQGFFFEDDEFTLPENIAVTDEQVILLYNPYEAASYAEGQLRYMFPKETVEDWFNY